MPAAAPLVATIDSGEEFWLLAGGWVAALLFLWLWWSRVRFARLLKDVPAVPVSGVFVGLVETGGTVECDNPLRGGLSGIACVYHSWTVSEHWRRTETYTDSKGRVQTRTVTGSDVVASGGGQVDMRIRDQTGAIVVRTKGADWTPTTTYSREARRGDALYSTVAPGVSVSGSTGRRSFHEMAVPLGSKVWIFGNAFIRPDSSALEIGGRGDDNVFMISLKGEKAHYGCALWLAAVGFLFGAAAAGAAGIGLSRAVRAAMPSLAEDPARLAGAGVSLMVFGGIVTTMWLVIVRNGAVRVRTRWQRAVSLVDVELKRRADLIPNLVAVTQGLAGHERHLQEAMAKLRAGAAVEASLAAIVEAYPQLRADGAFLALQRQLSDTESRIAQARTFELQSRQAFLDRLQTFPEGFIARLTGVGAPPPALASPAPPPSSPGSPPRG
ncbi:MAG: LemA family protein [Phycisphaerales bacterium]